MAVQSEKYIKLKLQPCYKSKVHAENGLQNEIYRKYFTFLTTFAAAATPLSIKYPKNVGSATRTCPLEVNP